MLIIPGLVSRCSFQLDPISHPPLFLWELSHSLDKTFQPHLLCLLLRWEAKMWTLGMLIAIECHCPQACSPWSMPMSLCVCMCASTHNTSLLTDVKYRSIIYIIPTFSLYTQDHEFTLMPTILIQCHRVHSHFLFSMMRTWWVCHRTHGHPVHPITVTAVAKAHAPKPHPVSLPPLPQGSRLAWPHITSFGWVRNEGLREMCIFSE